MMRKLPVDELRSAMLHCITEHMTAQQLFDHIYKIISLPMICFDPSFSLIAYSFPRPFYYPHWEWIADSGSASQEDILEYNYLSNQEEMVRNSGSQLFDYGSTSGFAQYCGAVMNGDQLLAYCGIITEDAEPEDVKTAADLLIKALSVIVRTDLKDDGTERSLLLDDELSSQHKDYLTRHCSGQYLFVTATCGANQRSTLQYIKSNLHWKGFRMLSCFSGDDMLYIIVGQQNSYLERESFINALRDLSLNHGVLFGLSDYFSDPYDIPPHRQQSVLALSMSATSGTTAPISLFKDHYGEYICQCAMEYYGTEHCMYPAVKILKDDDKRRGHDNLRTLKVWFDAEKNNAKAAASLGIHQATMINRLKHITALIGHEPAKYIDSLMLELKMYETMASEAIRSERK